MYTQCPDCSTAFRVTAEVLKQAAGKVRCGGCGIAFNALEYLSEQMPEQPARQEPEEHLPELTPEPPESGERTPMAISAEQSAALLKTLDELAGSDIRIEDTGVEWRVLDDDPCGDDSIPTSGGDEFMSTSGGVDELLDESPTPVDQFLTKTPNDIDASEIFEESANAPAQTPVDELRFDDNTPLPDDFDLDDESSYAAEPESPMQSTHPSELDEAGDIALGEPEEWADILGEFAEPPEPYVPPLDAELEALSQTDTDDEVAADPADAGDIETPLDMDTQFALQAEAMGIDLSGIRASDDIEVVEDETADDEIAEEAPETDADELGHEETPAIEEDIGAPAELDATDDDLELELAETGEALALADGEAGEDYGDNSGEDSGEVPELELARLEPADETGGSLQLDGEPGDDFEEAADLVAEDDTNDGESEPVGEAPLEFGSIEQAMAELEEESDVFDADFFANEDAEEGATSGERGEEDVALDVEDDDGVLEEQQEFIEQPDEEESPHYVPPQSEEEQTLNRLIDQELFSMAVEDEDGFASTIVVAEDDARDAIAEVHAQQPGEGDGFESIIMEGEFVQTALEQEKRKADIAEAAELAEQARLAREAAEQEAGSGRRPGMAAAAVVLALLLVAQVLHQSRDALATIPAFNEAVGPLYRAIGMPLAPAWDVTGWHFEARREILDEAADTLTVISRIGNTSTDALPYPLINISLTDRFEETVGTRTLDPSHYLTDDLDPSKMVRPGNNFTAVMTIQSPAENATGYKLQACYRQPDAQLRCHNPSFK